MQTGCDGRGGDGFEAFSYRLSSITGTYIETGAQMPGERTHAQRFGR